MIVQELRYEEVEHTADIAIRVRGRDLAELFANAAYGMASQMTDIRDLEVTTMKEVELQADDAEILLVEWLSELVYLGELEDVAFIEFDMARVTPHSVQAVVRGGPIKEHQAHIKAVTFSELDIRKTDDGLETVIVFDV